MDTVTPRADTETEPVAADPIEAARPGFRAWQRSWRRRIAASRRLAPYEGDRVDPLAPTTGRWSA